MPGPGAPLAVAERFIIASGRPRGSVPRQLRARDGEVHITAFEEPAIPADHVRLYRGAAGQRAPARDHSLHGRWFSTSRDTAEHFAAEAGRRGRLSFVDIPEAEFSADGWSAHGNEQAIKESGGSIPPDEQAYILPAALSNRAVVMWEKASRPGFVRAPLPAQSNNV